MAEANYGGADVTISPETIPALKVGSEAVTVTVTVSKDLAGVDTEYTRRDYTLALYYGEGMDPDPLADGGYVSFIPGESAGSYYEAHTFLEPGESRLSFFDASLAEVEADILIVAGGGGAGGSLWGGGGGGGGAGGLLYQPGQTLTLTEGSVPVTVGKG